MELTKNLQLKKPAENDFYNVADFNENAEILDTEVQALKDGKFDKTGGTVNGSIVTSGHISKTTDNSSLNVFGASGFAKGAELSLYGKDSTKAGVWELVAHNGDTYGKLEGSPTGSLLWNGNDVITAKGGTLNGTLNSKALGGQATLAGYGGCQLWLLSKDDTTNKGGFILRTIAESGGGFVDFVGRYDGTLKWNGKDVITSAGGTFTGNALNRSVDNDMFIVRGATAYKQGAQLVLYGKDASEYAGGFRLLTGDGTDSGYLTGKPDGSLSWLGKEVTRCVYGLWDQTSGFTTYRYTGNTGNGGLQIVYGNSTTNAKADKVFTFPLPFSNVPNVVISRRSGASTTTAAQVWERGRNSTTFTLYADSSTAFNFIAMGWWEE